MRDTGYFKPADPRGRWGKQNARWRGRGGGVQLTAAAALLAGAYGLSLAASDDSMWIADQSTPANNFEGAPSSKLTTTRASGAMYWNSSGVLTLAGNNELRRDFDPRLSATAERCGYLIEEARTNLALRNEDFGNAAWTKSELTVSSDAATAPDGSVNFDKFIPSTNAANHTAIQSTTTTAAAYSMSFFAKAAGYNFIYCRLYNNDGSPLLKGAWFNLGTGTVGTTESGITASIVSVGNGVYRCVATLATAYNGAGNSLILGVSNADNTTSFTGDGTSGVLIFGAQLELGSFASSYIPTAGSTVTRAADLVTLAGTLFPLSQTEGTLYAKFAGVATSAAQAYVASLDNNSTAELIAISKLTNNALRYFMNDGSVAQVNMDSTATAASLTQAKAAIGYKLNDSAAAFLGETVQTDIICTMPTTDRLTIGNRSGGATPGNMWIFELAYFPTRKTNSQLQALASGYASDALLLMGAETQGLTFSATDQSMSILDTGTPANVYTGELSAKLGSIRTSSALTTLSSGLLGWGPENLDIQSQAFDNASWTESNCTLTDLQADGPRGALTMASYVESTSGARMSNAANRPAIAGVTYTVSRVFKRLNCDWVAWYIGDDLTPTNGMRVWFNLATGAAGSNTSQGSGWTFTSAAVTDVGSGAYRLSVTFVAGGNIAIRHQTASADANTGRADVGSGAGVGSGFYIDMAQTEKASSASTYKPTTSAAYYGLRLDYDSRLSGGPGYLVEEARTNLCLQSQTLDNGSWTKLDTTITANQATAPDGTTTVDLSTEGTAGTALLSQASLTIVANATSTFSMFLKRGNTDWVRFLFFESASSTNRVSVWVNLATGALGTVTNGGTATGGAATIQSVGGGIYRVMLSGAINNSATSITIGVSSANADNSLTRVNNATYYAWGAQLEAGAFATSYIPTTTASVTRAEDNTGVISTIPIGSAFTLVGKANRIAAGSANNIMLVGNAGSDYAVLQLASGDPKAAVIASSSTVTNLDGGTAATPPGTDTLAAAFATDDVALSYNGAAAVTDATSTPPAYVGIRLGRYISAAQHLNGWLRHGRYFPTRKSNADLAVLAAAA